MSTFVGPEAPDFDVEEYLEDRSKNPSLVVVEFGHGDNPIALKNLPFYRADRQYIGVEANLRDRAGDSRKMLTGIVQENPSRNLTFLNHDLVGRVDLIIDKEISEVYEGEYNTRTKLGDGIADEVFLGNVITDPVVANKEERVLSLLNELTRISKPGATVVMRETITPNCTLYLTDENLAKSGLMKIKEVMMSKQRSTWLKLEHIYGPRRSRMVDCDSLYRVLAKTAEQTS